MRKHGPPGFIPREDFLLERVCHAEPVEVQNEAFSKCLISPSAHRYTPVLFAKLFNRLWTDPGWEFSFQLFETA